MLWECREGCKLDQPKSAGHPGECKHGRTYAYTKRLGSNGTSKEKQGAPRRRRPLKQGRGFAASPAQRAKVRDLRCIVTGQDRHEATIHPMHVWDRGRGGCDDPLCVVPGRGDIHRLYDEKKLDILPALLTGEYYDELAHIIEAHHVSPTMLLERVTGQRWAPVERTDVPA